MVSYLSEHSTDAHLHSVKHHAERHAKLMEASSQSVQAESALFEEEEEDDDLVQHPLKAAGSGDVVGEREMKSSQRMKSVETMGVSGSNLAMKWSGGKAIEKIEAAPGVTHCVQTIRELENVPVIVTADISKSPPVLKIFAVRSLHLILFPFFFSLS